MLASGCKKKKKEKESRLKKYSKYYCYRLENGHFCPILRKIKKQLTVQQIKKRLQLVVKVKKYPTMVVKIAENLTLVIQVKKNLKLPKVKE